VTAASQPIDVRQMAIAHRTFRDAYSESARLVRAAPTPSPARVRFLADQTGEALAVALDELNAVLEPHLRDEEQKVVPLAAVTLTQEEWDALGDHVLAQIPPDKKSIAFGMLLEPLDEADRAVMMGVLPTPSGSCTRS
jgi:hypothetical protein